MPPLKDSSPFWKAFFAVLMVLQMLIAALVGVMWTDTRESRDTSRANALWVMTIKPIVADNARLVRKHELELGIIAATEE